MKQLLYTAALMMGVVFHGVAADSPEERFWHPAFATVAPPARLPQGKESGTYRLAATCTVDFSLQTDFPVAIVLLDYAKKELFKQAVASRKPFTLSYDLKPGTYEVISKPATASKYWEATGFGVHIDIHGGLTYVDSHSFGSPTFWHVRKIEIISPGNMETIKAKTISIGQGTDAMPVIPGDLVILKWKAVPGVKSYVVRVWSMANPFHPESFGGDTDAGDTTSTNQLQLKKDDYLDTKIGYAWTVTDNGENNDGHVARGLSIFLTPGTREFYAAQVDRSTDGDAWVDPGVGVRFRENTPRADESRFVFVEAIGSDCPALKEGLHPGLQVFSVNGAGIANLDDLRTILAKISPNTPVSLVVGDWKMKQTISFVAH